MTTHVQDFPCLLIRQPYASLIAHGLKRVEFRSYPTRVRGRIWVAASKGPPLKTEDSVVNAISKNWPRGLVLASANLAAVEFWDIRKLKQSVGIEKDIPIHGTMLRVYDVPLGEPVKDVNMATERTDWKSWAWILQDVSAVREALNYYLENPSTWGKVLSSNVQ
jgi:hypothetical protein